MRKQMFTALQNIEQQKKLIMEQQPRCMVCAARRFPAQLRKVTQDDVDEYVSDGEGYGPPEVGGMICSDFCS